MQLNVVTSLWPSYYIVSADPEVVGVRHRKGAVAREAVARWSAKWEEVLQGEEGEFVTSPDLV